MTGLGLRARLPDQVDEERGGRDDERGGDGGLHVVREEVAGVGQHEHGPEEAGREPDGDERDRAALMGGMPAPFEDPEEQDDGEDDEHRQLEILHGSMIGPAGVPRRASSTAAA